MRQILSDVDTLVTQYNLDHIRDLLRKGALLSDDPSDLERVDRLTPDEKSTLLNDAVPVSVRSMAFALVYAFLL
jgi:hypothetical protein